MANWVAGHMSSRTAAGVIQETFEFVEFLRQTTYELTPADHPVVKFFRQLGISCYDIVSRKIDTEVSLTCSMIYLELLSSITAAAVHFAKPSAAGKNTNNDIRYHIGPAFCRPYYRVGSTVEKGRRNYPTLPISSSVLPPPLLFLPSPWPMNLKFLREFDFE